MISNEKVQGLWCLRDLLCCYVRNKPWCVNHLQAPRAPQRPFANHFLSLPGLPQFCIHPRRPGGYDTRTLFFILTFFDILTASSLVQKCLWSLHEVVIMPSKHTQVGPLYRELHLPCNEPISARVDVWGNVFHNMFRWFGGNIIHFIALQSTRSPMWRWHYSPYPRSQVSGLIMGV